MPTGEPSSSVDRAGAGTEFEPSQTRWLATSVADSLIASLGGSKAMPTVNRRNHLNGAAVRLMREEAKPLWLGVALALGVLIVSVSGTLTGPMIVQNFVSRATVGESASTLAEVALTYLGVALLAGVTKIIASYLAVTNAWKVADSLRVRLLRRAVIERPVLEAESQPVGEVLERVDGNCDIVGKSIAESGFQLLGNIAVVIGVVTIMITTVPAAGAGIAALVLIVSLILGRLARRAVQRWELAREREAQLFGLIGDSLAARDDLLPMNKSHWVTTVIEDKLTRLLRIEGRAYISGRAFWPLTQLFSAVAFGLGIGFGLHALGQGALSIGTLVMIYLYADLLQSPVEEMSSQWGDLQRTIAILGITARTLDAPVKDNQTERLPAGVLPSGPLSVEFDGVTFGYGNTPVVRDVSLQVPAGRSLGIVGSTGAGKSTLINLLCGLATPDEGNVRIGGFDVSQIDPNELSTRLTVLSQRAHIFADSVRDNITLFDDTVAEDEIWRVLKQLNADHWVCELPAGLETLVGAAGHSLSVGEMQVIACARALIRPVGLLVVDEGVSKLDPEAERAWSGLLDTVMQETTAIVVEHRHTALRGVERVVEMTKGKIATVTLHSEGGIIR